MRRPTLVVVKVGGDILLDEAQRNGLAQNVGDLLDDNVRVVIVHGGGPQVTALQERLGLEARKIAGRRVTTREDLQAVVQAICGEVNVALVSTLLAARVRAFGFHGASACVVRCEKRRPVAVPGVEGLVDYGEVGDVKAIDAELLRGLVDLGVVPVLATLGASESGAIYNVNADTTAVQVAAALQADVLLLVTAVGGVFRDLHNAASRIPLLSPGSARKLIQEGVISGGMIPKVEEALSILDSGVGAVSILGAQDEGSFRSAVAGDGARGTRFAPDEV